MRDSLDLSVRRVSRRGRLRKKVFIGTAAVVCAALAAAATLRFGPGAVAWLAAAIPSWAAPPAVALLCMDTVLTALLLRRTRNTGALRWYVRLFRRKPA